MDLKRAEVPDYLLHSLHVLRREFEGDLWIVLRCVAMLPVNAPGHPSGECATKIDSLRHEEVE